MESQNYVRIKMLKIWELLCQETDEDHPMDTITILQKLKEMGIVCDRRTLYNDIKILNECGYEIICRRSRNNEYFVMDRSFDLPELHILLDAIQAAGFITKSKSKILIDKVASLAGSRKGEVLKRNIVAFNTTKNCNEAIYYSVNEIIEAIKQQKKIAFLYFDYDHKHNRVYRKDGHHYVVNPFATVFPNDNYYLVCYNDVHRTITHYRIDRMDKVKILPDKPISPLPEGQTFSISRHKKQVFGMYTGNEVEVTFVIDKELIDVVFEKFGEKTKIMPYGDDKYLFRAEVQVSPVFLGWVCAFGKRLRVTSPQSVVDSIQAHLEELRQNYETKGE